MKIKQLLFAAVSVTLLGGGCVSTQKYNDMQQARDHYKAQYESMRTVEQENQECQNDLRIAKAKLTQLDQALSQQKTDLERIKDAQLVLASQYERAADENTRILSEYSSTRTQMEEQLVNTSDELTLRDRQLSNLENTIGLQNYDLQSREERVAELERLLAEQDEQMAAMRFSLDRSMSGFDQADLDVSEREGKIYVTMSNKLLFPKGSTKLDAAGENALKKLAAALQDNPDIDVIVEGHTDNTGAVDYNLKLSVDRAVAVTQILSLNGVLPRRITTAGRGMHHPIVPNTTEESRARNRRVEVVLSPNMDAVYELSK